MAATRQEARDEARRLVVAEGYTYAQAAEATGIPRDTLTKWGGAEGWMDQRKAGMSYTAQVRAMKAKLMTQITDLGAEPRNAQAVAQLIHAWKSLETAYPEHRYDRKADPRIRRDIGGEFLTFLVEFLGERDRNAVTAIEPHIEALAAAWEDRGVAS